MLVIASVSESLFNLASEFVGETGLAAVFLLMVAESACIPIPSEATMLFAGFAVTNPGAAHGHHLTLLGIVLAGVLGNLVGSWISYGVGRFGRIELIERHGHWLHVKPSHIEWADRWFQRYGAPAVFFSRMLPIIRTFISLPAGVARMPFWRFTLLTLAGCVPWVLALALAGEALGSEWENARKYFEYVDYAVVVLVVAAIVYAVIRRRRGRSDSGDPATDAAG
jgi:membrane protein DedA with SNARE-associated domain